MEPLEHEDELDVQDKHLAAAEVPQLPAPSAAEFHEAVAEQAQRAGEQLNGWPGPGDRAARLAKMTDAETREIAEMWEKAWEKARQAPDAAQPRVLSRVDLDVATSVTGELEAPIIADELDLDARVAALDFSALGVDPARRWLDA